MMSEDNLESLSQEMKGLPVVVLGDEGLPRLYEDSEISIRQVPKKIGNPKVFVLCPFLFSHLVFLYIFKVFVFNTI